MTNATLKKEHVLGEILLGLPVNTSSLVDHIKNIDYGISKLKAYVRRIKDPVIFYVLARSAMGAVETDHQILSKEMAERKRKDNPNLRFRYYTLDDLLRERRYVKEGRYSTKKGFVIDDNPAYS